MVDRLLLVSSEEHAPPPTPGQLVVVTDAGWWPEPVGRDDFVPIGPAVRRALASTDFFIEARLRLDEWAAELDLDRVTSVDGTAGWARFRMALWMHLLRAMHWRAVLDELAHDCWPSEALVVPFEEPDLLELASILAGRDGIGVAARREQPPTSPVASAPAPVVPARRGPDVRPSPPRPAASWFRRRPRRQPPPPPPPDDAVVRSGPRFREAFARERVDQLKAEGPGRLLALVALRVAQRTDGVDGDRQVDAFLTPVIEACRGSSLEPILIAAGGRARDDTVWAAIEADPRLLPELETLTLYDDPDDRADAEAQAAAAAAAFAALPSVPILDGGVDLAPIVRDRLLTYLGKPMTDGLVKSRQAGRMLADLGSAGLMLYSEYTRREWLAAGRAANVPTYAVQHGIIYPGHVGYVHRRSAAVQVPDRTFVYGPYEQDVLQRLGGYTDEEVVVAGPPRQAFMSDGFDAPLTEAERTKIRDRIGVAADDRMLVISTTHERMHQRFYWPNCLGQLLDRPLPGVHLVFKQHPAEQDEGSYRSLVEAIARRAGVPAPTVSVVKDIDLFSLLRAADAHLSLFSTVLTDAVAAGVPNLVATTQARQDLLDYVAYGVATPVGSHADLVQALSDCRRPDASARAAFLAAHMVSGDAVARIKEEIVQDTAALRGTWA